MGCRYVLICVSCRPMRQSFGLSRLARDYLRRTMEFEAGDVDVVEGEGVARKMLAWYLGRLINFLDGVHDIDEIIG